jgi:hypothetical protein
MNEFSRFNNGNENDDEDSSAQDDGSGSQAGGQERDVVAHCGSR